MGLWKWSANPPSDEEVCNGGGNGSAARGTVNFTVNCTYCPRSITITITVTSGGELSGANARDVYVMESNTSMYPTCLNPNSTLDVTNSIGRFDSPNNVPVTLGPIDVSSCATHFAVILMETGGGGQDTYTTGRVKLVCPSLPPCTLPYEDWKYRMRFNVTDNFGSGLTDYQVPIHLDPKTFNYAKASENGSDLRFTEDDLTTTLDYWIETWNPSGDSTVWVKLNVSANSTDTFFMHYGNPCVGSESNGSDTSPPPIVNLGEEVANHVRTDYFGGTAGNAIVDNTTVTDGDVVLSLDPASQTTRTYNYVGVSQASTNHSAYESDSDCFPYESNQSNRNDYSEATNAEYLAIDAYDGAEWVTDDPGSFDRLVTWYHIQINISESPISSITQLDFNWNGNTDGGTEQHDTYVQINGSNWEDNSAWVHVGGPVDIPIDTDTWVNGSITSDIGNYIDSRDGSITFVTVHGGTGCDIDINDDMRVNYVELVVSYIAAYASTGDITSINVPLSGRSMWSIFYANHSLPANTGIGYQLRAINGSPLCNITAAQALLGYDVSTCAGSISPIRLYSNLSTTDGLATPYLQSWSVTKQ